MNSYDQPHLLFFYTVRFNLIQKFFLKLALMFLREKSSFLGMFLSSFDIRVMLAS